MDFFYITYQNKTDDKSSFPSDIEMGYLDNYKYAEAYVADTITNIYRSQFYELATQNDKFNELTEEKLFYPYLITNDAKMYIKFKGVFSPRKFQLFCKAEDNYDCLAKTDKILFDNGRGNKDAYENFIKLINGEGKWAYQVTKFGKWLDETTGYEVSYEMEESWKLENRYYVNEKLKESFIN